MKLSLLISIMFNYLSSFRNNCSVSRREKWYVIHIHLYSVISLFLPTLLLYRSILKGFKIPFTYTGIIGYEMINYPGVMIICAYAKNVIDDADKFILENFEDYTSRGEEVHQKILKKTKFLKWGAYGCDVGTLVMVVLLINTEYRCKKYWYIFMLLGSFDIDPITYWILFVLYLLFFIERSKIMMSAVNLFPYLIFQYTLQYDLLKEGVRSLQKFRKDDRAYHYRIKEELRKLIKHSQILTRYHSAMSKTLRLPLFMVLLLLAFCLVFIYLMSLFADNISQFILIFAECIAQFSALALLAAIGQYYTNQTEELWDELLKCSWYEWSMENKRSYHILLTFHAEKEHKIYSGIIPLTHDSIILLGRRIMAAITFVDYLLTFRNHSFIWRREKWYMICIHLNTVFRYIFVALLYYMSCRKIIEIQSLYYICIALDLTQYPFVTIMFTLLMKKIDDLDKFISDNFENYASRGEEIHQKILKKTRYLNWVAYVSEVMALLTTTVILYAETVHNTFLYIYVFLAGLDMGPIFYWTFIALYFCPFYLQSFRIMYSAMNVFLYFILQYILQFILMKESVKSIQKYIKDDKADHNSIKEELKKIIIHSQILTRYHNLLFNILRIPFFMLCFLFLGCVILVYFVIIFTHELMDELLKCPWYDWNMENKKSYYILLTFNGSRENILYMGLTPITYPTSINVGRNLASAVTFLRTVGTDFFAENRNL